MQHNKTSDPTTAPKAAPRRGPPVPLRQDFQRVNADFYEISTKETAEKNRTVSKGVEEPGCPRDKPELPLPCPKRLRQAAIYNHENSGGEAQRTAAASDGRTLHITTIQFLSRSKPGQRGPAVTRAFSEPCRPASTQAVLSNEDVGLAAPTPATDQGTTRPATAKRCAVCKFTTDVCGFSSGPREARDEDFNDL